MRQRNLDFYQLSVQIYFLELIIRSRFLLSLSQCISGSFMLLFVMGKMRS